MVTDVDFVKTYQAATSTKEVAAKLEMGVSAVSARVAKLRKAGVNLKKFGRARAIVDVDGLNALIA
jgi:biotin operon repressor